MGTEIRLTNKAALRNYSSPQLASRPQHMASRPSVWQAEPSVSWLIQADYTVEDECRAASRGETPSNGPPTPTPPTGQMGGSTDCDDDTLLSFPVEE
jgi:hypothetical protein